MEQTDKRVEELNKTYFEYLTKRWNECLDKRLKVRIVIDFNRGSIGCIQNQEVLEGVTSLGYGFEKITQKLTGVYYIWYNRD